MIRGKIGFQKIIGFLVWITKTDRKSKNKFTRNNARFLYPTIDGFVDVLEIKLPKDDVLVEDSSHKESWKWTSETNSAIGQVVNYLTEIDRLRLENENKIQNETGNKVLFLKPRAFILIGNSQDWSNQKKEALRKLNYYLHNIEVITYKDLLDRGNQFINGHNLFTH